MSSKLFYRVNRIIPKEVFRLDFTKLSYFKLSIIYFLSPHKGTAKKVLTPRAAVDGLKSCDSGTGLVSSS